jgi:hypothetical protein
MMASLHKAVSSGNSFTSCVGLDQKSASQQHAADALHFRLRQRAALKKKYQPIMLDIRLARHDLNLSVGFSSE